jgi:SpoVK/Ycf46/Vps4 family AAA+-type ATPase
LGVGGKLRELAEVRVLWSNMYRVRTIFASNYDISESFRSYRLLSFIAKYSADLYELMADSQSRNSGLVLRIKYNRRLSPGVIAHVNLLAAMNLLSELVEDVGRDRGFFAALFASYRSLSRDGLISCSLTFSRSPTRPYVRPAAVLLVSGQAIGTRNAVKASKDLAEEALEALRVTIAKYKREYLDVLNALEEPKPVAIVLLQGKALSVEEIRAVVSDGSEYREVKIPIKNPEWSIEDLPPKIIEEVKLIVVNPFRSGLPFATKGAFITGPPGVGKSVMAEALANALGLKVVELKPFTYRSMWYGATEKMLNAIMNQVYKRRKELALVIDDAEFLSSRKYTIHEAHLSELSTILYHLQRSDRPFTILTANNPDLVDPALLRPGRVDVTILVGYPDKEMRRKALLRNASKYRVRFASERVVDYIVSNTPWYSLAELDALLRLAASRGSGTVGLEEVEWARRRVVVSPTERRSIQDYLRWWSTKVQGIVITYVPTEVEVE